MAEVLVDATEDVASGLLDLLAVEQAHQIFENLGLEDAEVLGQDAQQWLELGLDGRHGVADELGQVGSARGRPVHDGVVAGRLRQPERAAAQVVGREHLALGHPAGCLFLLDLPVRSLEAVGRMAQEDHAQHRHEVIAGGELGIGAEVVRGLPEVGFELLDVFEAVVGHAAQEFPSSLARVLRSSTASSHALATTMVWDRSASITA